MVIKVTLLSLLLLVIISLLAALVFLVRDQGNSNRVLWSLAIRILLAVVFIVLLLVGYTKGLITPHAL